MRIKSKLKVYDSFRSTILYIKRCNNLGIPCSQVKVFCTIFKTESCKKGRQIGLWANLCTLQFSISPSHNPQSISHVDTSFIREHIEPWAAKVILRLDKMNTGSRGRSDEMHVPSLKFSCCCGYSQKIRPRRSKGEKNRQEKKRRLTVENWGKTEWVACAKGWRQLGLVLVVNATWAFAWPLANFLLLAWGRRQQDTRRWKRMKGKNRAVAKKKCYCIFIWPESREQFEGFCN